MNETNKQEVFAALAELARRYPHWRVGQLVANVAGWADAEIWDVDDGQLLQAVRAHLPPPPGGVSALAGRFADDPTLRDICEEIYRERDADSSHLTPDS